MIKCRFHGTELELNENFLALSEITLDGIVIQYTRNFQNSCSYRTRISNPQMLKYFCFIRQVVKQIHQITDITNYFN